MNTACLSPVLGMVSHLPVLGRVSHLPVLGMDSQLSPSQGTLTPPSAWGEVLVWGPSAVFSLASLAAAFIVTLLPETKDKIMAQGIDQPEHVME
ncbi:hypothetical protein Pcinc_009440 [Petrolisthes cinctipes]|uniref:Uncharacterized protein n=1 Tax=Petrolisthes cinctipes TaxID=88211 RepID=A0AAE1G586_PETCI|nr:hypothetical protein Pcinc_009440 [Petrolisthes cinctipes]